MASTPAQDLQARVSARKIAVVVGSGVSAATCPRVDVATWKGLLTDGAIFCDKWTHPARGWSTQVKRLISSRQLEAAAHMIVSELKSRDQSTGLFGKWLASTVGELKTDRYDPAGHTAQSSRLIDTIWSLRAPVLTTNYDTLIEQAVGVRDVKWTQPSAVQLALEGSARNVVHLHGVWDDPDTVIMDPQSYGRLSAHTPTQEALKATVYDRSMLFIGCGAGVDDPTFSSLRRYLSETLGWSRNQHFLLSLKSDVKKMRQAIGRDPIQVISYGNAHKDLEPYLRRELVSVAPPGP